MTVPPLVRSFMVVGTEAGVGKTLVTAAIVQSLCRRGVHAIAMTPAPKWILHDDGSWHSVELEQLASVSAFGLPARALSPCVLAGSDAWRNARVGADPELSLEAVVDTFQILSTWADAVAVDASVDVWHTAGVTFDSADLARELRLPLVMVIGVRPGCIEAALGHVQALTGRGLECAGWIANRFDPAVAGGDRISDALRQRMPGPCLGSIPRLPRPAPADAGKAIDMHKTLMALAP